MSKLTTKQRNNLKSSQFAGKDRSFPIEDRAHAVAAKGRATQAVNAGRMSESTADKIRAKANKVLKK